MILLICLLGLAVAGQSSNQAGIVDLERAFRDPPGDCRPMMRWWWFGPAVTKAGLEREMRLMKEGGIGGFEVQPVYPVVLDDEAKGIRNLRYLSKEFLEALRFTSEKARELGLRMDLTLGSGWPYGGPHVPINQAASRLRWERVKVAANSRRVPLPDITAGERLLAAFAGGSRQELSDIKEGVLWLPESAERPSEVWFFISSRTGQQVKRAAVGAEGFVFDHYDRSALDNYLKNLAEPMLQALGPSPPFAVFCDSLEVYGSDWTGDFLEQFRRRNGYDLRPRLPDLAAELGPDTAAIRHDWGKTLTELLEERFFSPMREWSRAHRTLFRIQGYGIPPARLSSNALADLPEGEGHQWKMLTASRWASSASHLYGQTVTSSETWTWLHSPSFRATPLDVKLEADRHFLQGINQLIGHGWPYTAEGVEYPGWRFYAAGVFNEKNPWWIVMPDLSLYLQRLSFLLRQGRPVNDVALYLPNSDAWSRFSLGQVNLLQSLGERLGPDVVGRILEAGFGLDFIDDQALELAGRVEKGALTLGGSSYRIVVLPGVETIPAATLRKLSDFARGGGILVATRRLPATAPGFMATETDKTEVRETVQRLFGAPSASGRFIAEEAQLGSALASFLRADVSFSPSAPEIGFVHRSTGAAEIYFLANTGNVRHETKATFRVDGMEPEWWDPMTGNTQPAAIAERSPGALALAVDLEPYASRVLVFSQRAQQAPAAARTALPPIDLSTGWQVTFGAAGTPIRMERLRSWIDDDSTRFYSGLASYEKSFAVPEGYLRDGVRVKLDFGETKPLPPGQARPRTQRLQALLEAPVREAAVVYVNGRRAGSVWCPPYAVEITPHLKPGENQIRVVVGNLALNYMAGHALPDYKLLSLRYGLRFEPQDMDQVQPVSSGLLGPIRLVATESPRPK